MKLLPTLTLACTLIFGSVLMVPSILAQEKKNAEKIDLRSISTEEFMNFVRRAPSMENWSKMSGKIQHRRKGNAVLECKVRLAMRFMPTRVVGQLILDGNEMYELGQTFTNPPHSSVQLSGAALDEKQAKLPVMGISANDFVLSFLYQDVLQEEMQQRVSIFNCRVFVMSPDENKDYTRLYISTDYAFPIRVEWFKENPIEKADLKPYRTLEIVSVKEKGRYALVSQLRMDGPDWKTKIEFTELDAGSSADGIPKDLFIKK